MQSQSSQSAQRGFAGDSGEQSNSPAPSAPQERAPSVTIGVNQYEHVRGLIDRTLHGDRWASQLAGLSLAAYLSGDFDVALGPEYGRAP